MARIVLRLLGGLHVYDGSGCALAVPARKAQALLAYLALQPQHCASRARLAALLWSDSAEPLARASLRQALLVLRRALGLGESDLLTGPGEQVALAAQCADVDVLTFERLVDAAAPEALEQAAALYAGDLLEAFETREPAFDDWLAARRQRLRERALDAHSRLLAWHSGAGRFERAIEVALRLLALDPLQESVHRSLMELYAQQGRRGAALRQFRICRELLARELGSAPQAATLRLRERIESQRDAAPPNDAAPAEAELRHAFALVAEREGDDADPEVAQRGAESFAAAAQEVVSSHGGEVDVRFGHSVMAWFGAAASHGNDAERALRAALQLAARAVGARIGLAAGTVLVTRQREATVVRGDASARAARLAASARVGEVLAGETAWGLLQSIAEGVRFSAAELPPSLRDSGAWRVAALRTRPAWRPALVGRRSELAQLAASLRSCHDGGGLTVHVRGDPGVGKTRLVEELRDLAAAQGYACHFAAVLDFGSGAAHDAVRLLVRSLLGAAHEADEAPAVAGALARGGVDARFEPQLLELLQRPLPPLLREVYDAMDAATRAQHEREAIAQLLQRCSAAQPQLLVIEDLHWAAARTLAQAAAIAAACEGCRSVLVTTARTDGDPLGAAWRAAAGVTAMLTIDLGPLRWAEASALAAQFGDAADAYTLRCIERSGGNPLFLQQLLNAPRAAAAAAAETLPGSVQSVVQARLDALGAAERHAVRVASVLGQRFALAVLDHLLEGAAWDAAAAAALLRIERDDGVFVHALVHEGAYASLPRSQRTALHTRAARWYAGRDATLRALHLDRAEDPMAAAAYLEAARAAAHAQRHDDALRLAERGLELASDAAVRFELACCRAEVLHERGDTAAALAAFDAALAAAHDDGQRCRAWIGRAAALRVRDDFAAAAVALDQAERAARSRRLLEPLARIHLLRGNLGFPRGDLDGCQREHAASLALARQAQAVDVEVAALGGLGDADFMRGHMLSARERFAGCVALAKAHGLRRVEAAHRPMAAITLWYAGDARAALDESHEAIAVARQIGHHRAEAIARHGAYQQCQALRRHDEALEHAERALELARRIDAPRFEAEALAFRGELHRCRGARAAARADLDEALRIARATGIAFMGPVFLGMLARALDDAAGRAAALAEAEALLADNRLAHNHLLFRRDAIDACLDEGDGAAALRHAAALAQRTRAQPLPWSNFLVARADALARGACSDTLQGLRDEGQRIGLIVELDAVDAALARAAAGP